MLEYSLAFGLGVVFAAVVVAMLARRSVVRVREAERRARRAERMAELGAMTAGLAHEIKNPLSTLGLNAQLLEEAIEDLDIPADERGRLTRRIDGLRREADRLRGILTDFLDYAGELRFEPVETDLNVLTSELGDFFLPQAEQQGARLRVSLDESAELRAFVDPPHLKQAVLNLMLNAVQAMAGGGGGELLLRTSRSDAAARIHVTDTGPGMDDAAMGKIFEPYFTTKAGGTGLGLPTTRRLIEGQGGELTVHSEPGKGTEFVIEAPLA